MSKAAIKITKRERPAMHVAGPVLATTKLRVRATRLGYYDHKRRRPGDVFVYAAPVVDNNATLPSWLELADASDALKETGAQAALKAATDDVRGSSGAATAAATASSGDDLGI